ncbi:DNA-binding protein [Panacagrimonas sp.]|uniref:DNA-binding protein n=1 Tax=Panacagrimonas sp. TaxID=2480088 RepID=UPI003B51B42E
MARGISEADVLEAADALLARGERPTIERVRQKLGRGSPNTVNRHLDAWWTSLAQRVQGRSRSTLPASLLELCGRLYEGVREQARVEAQADVTLAEDRLNVALTDLEAQKNALLLERAGIAAAGEKLAAELTSLRERNEVLAGEKANLQGEVGRINSIAAEATASAMASRSALEAAQGKHKAEIQRVRDQWEGNEKRWLNEIVHMREDAKRSRAEHAAAVKALQTQLKEVQASLARALKGRLRLDADLVRADAARAKEREARIAAEATSKATAAALQGLNARLGSPKAHRRRIVKTTKNPGQS